MRLFSQDLRINLTVSAINVHKESEAECQGEAAFTCNGHTDTTCSNYSPSSHFVLFKVLLMHTSSVEMKGVCLNVLILQSYMF